MGKLRWHCPILPPGSWERGAARGGAPQTRFLTPRRDRFGVLASICPPIPYRTLCANTTLGFGHLFALQTPSRWERKVKNGICGSEPGEREVIGAWGREGLPPRLPPAPGGSAGFRQGLTCLVEGRRGIGPGRAGLAIWRPEAPYPSAETMASIRATPSSPTMAWTTSRESPGGNQNPSSARRRKDSAASW